MGRVRKQGWAFALERIETSLRERKEESSGKKRRVGKREDTMLGALERVWGGTESEM